MKTLRKFSLESTAAFTLVAIGLAIALRVVVTDMNRAPSTEARTAIHFNELVSVPSTDVLVPEPTQSQVVIASWYGSDFQGKTMSNGEPFDMYALTVAHKTLPLGTYLRLLNPENGRVVIAMVTDRGPFVEGRDIDLSWIVAKKLGLLKKGTGVVRIIEIFA